MGIGGCAAGDGCCGGDGGGVKEGGEDLGADGTGRAKDQGG